MGAIRAQDAERRPISAITLRDLTLGPVAIGLARTENAREGIEGRGQTRGASMNADLSISRLPIGILYMGIGR